VAQRRAERVMSVAALLDRLDAEHPWPPEAAYTGASSDYLRVYAPVASRRAALAAQLGFGRLEVFRAGVFRARPAAPRKENQNRPSARWSGQPERKSQ